MKVPWLGRVKEKYKGFVREKSNLTEKFHSFFSRRRWVHVRWAVVHCFFFIHTLLCFVFLFKSVQVANMCGFTGCSYLRFFFFFHLLITI